MSPETKEIKEETIELRSEEIDEILGKAPNWIIRRGIMVIFIVLAILFVGSWFYKYPDVICTKVVITTENVPAILVAKASGSIFKVFVKENQIVEKNDYIAIIENSANDTMVKNLSLLLNNLRPFLSNYDTLNTRYEKFQNISSLGELQTPFSAFRQNYADYIEFKTLDYHTKKIEGLNKQIKQYKNLYSKILGQRQIVKQKLELGKKQFQRDSTLYQNKTIATSEYEKSKSSFLDYKYSYNNVGAELDNALLQVSLLEQQILAQQQEYNEKTHLFQTNIKESFETLCSQITKWEQTYVIVAPHKGMVSFNKIWSENQQVNIGETVATVIPQVESKIIGKAQLPIVGSGKVKQKQKVNVKLDNYPYMEYGMLIGVVKTISLTPNENFYAVELSFPKGLTTNYKKQLPTTREMQGTAEIITDDLRLLERFVNPIKALWKK